MKLIAGPDSQLLESLRQQLRESTDVQWVVYKTDANGWHLTRTAVHDFLKRDLQNRFRLVGAWDGNCVTPRTAEHLHSVLRDLAMFGDRAAVSLWHPPAGLMHAKVYAGYAGGQVSNVVVGSSNLSEGGLSRNVEVSLVLRATAPEEELAAFLEMARLESVAIDHKWLDEHTGGVDDPPPTVDPWPHLLLGHVRHSFPLATMYLPTEKLGLPKKHVTAGPLVFDQQDQLRFDLLGLDDPALANVKKLRGRLNRSRPYWLLRYRVLETHLGLVIPVADCQETIDLIADLRRDIKTAVRQVDVASVTERLDRQLARWTTEICNKLALRGEPRQRVIRDLPPLVRARGEQTLRNLRQNLSVDLAVHGIPRFQVDEEEQGLNFRNAMTIALLHLIKGVGAQQKPDRDLEARLTCLNTAARSKVAASFIDRLRKASANYQRRAVSARAGTLELERETWYGLSLAKKRNRILEDIVTQ